MKKVYLFILGLALLGIVLLAVFYFSRKPETEEFALEGQCEINEMIFYHTDWCPWCKKVKDEGTIAKLKQLGVDITEINTDRGKAEHQIRGIPAFVIGASIYEGYKTFEELKELLNCE